MTRASCTAPSFASKPTTSAPKRAKASDKVPTPADDGDAEMERLKHGIERTRAEMSSTINALETRLTPSEIRATVNAELHNVEQRVRAVVGEELTEAKKLVEAELGEAKKLLKEGLNEAEEKVRRGLGDAKEAVKKDLSEAFHGAKQAVRAATLGRVEELADNIGDKMNQTRETLVDTVRQNPIPAALVGVGVAWLLMNRSQTASAGRGARGIRARASGEGERGYDEDGDFLHDARQSVGHVAGQVSNAVGQATGALSRAAQQVADQANRGLRDASDRAGNALHEATETASELAHKASNTAAHLAEEAGEVVVSVSQSARRGVRTVEQGLESAMEGNPLAVGAAALVLGGVVGFALPRTHQEDSLMGDARDRVLRRAGSAAEEAAQSVAHLAEGSVESIKQHVSQPARATE